MDIDLLWSFGGWFFILFPETINYCMAKLRSTSQISHFTNPRSCSSLFFVALLIITILITMLQSSTSMEVTSLPTHQPTSSNSHDESSTSSTATTTTDLHPKRTHHQSHPKPTRSFEAGAHEVPSGPNPISNR
uniref:CLAVATA3/ESR (CLE)-related protein TDIF n=1 Tax=Zinnia elegans TaxID=34245 RepID=TDIF_ZINEL|nr:RecName: Full=CLAVATA3/ESR (CLE)-related protein TDIF; AltName: Full=Tracheary element differentiation inhibitory factor; Contains: RecName: Full=TDIFp; Flags: Precursor [Zinnia elegans]ABL67522.1 CLAVATA3/ESR-related protein precursor [Zinnia elegans]